jgi:outer membrane protein OmpA-like peptidoglycan-associated protein
LGKIYGYYVSKEQFFPVSNRIDLRNVNKAIKVEEKFEMVSFKQMGDEGISIPLNTVFFNGSESTILPNSKPELKRIATIIKSNNLKVEISGHTDNAPDDISSQTMSEKRASAVKAYLVSEGCYSDMITFVGYGKTKPIAPNDTEEGRAKNIRVELKIVK